MPLTEPVKLWIQSNLRKRGWEIKRFSLGETERIVRYLQIHRISQVLDVGANIGQYSSALRAAGYSGKILSFEPLSQAHATLQENARNDPAWSVAPRCAVGAEPGEIEINISGNSVSSSVLPILADHMQSAPRSKYVGSEKTKVISLDTCDLIPANERIFLKVDTQGYESFVLQGAKELLGRVRGVQLELSFAALYQGQANFLELIQQLSAIGFEVWYMEPGFEDRESGRLLQADVIMFRPDADS